MRSFVINEKCDGCKGGEKTACMYICPNDLMVLEPTAMKAYNQEPDQCWECFYEFLNVKGRGHYVGTMMSVVQAEAGWFGEGDDYFWVDGQKPAIEGTGSEDYFNDAWGLHVNDGPHYGVTVAEGTGLGARMTAYRWHLLDPIPIPEIAESGNRASRLDLQGGRHSEVRLWRTHGSDLQCRVLVPGRHRSGPTASAVWFRPIASRQRAAN